MSVVPGDEVKAEEIMPGIWDRTLLDGKRGCVSTTMGDTEMDPESVLPLHTHPVEEVFYIVSGQAIAIVGRTEYPVGPGDSVLAPAGVPHGFRNEGAERFKMVFMHPALDPETVFLH